MQNSLSATVIEAVRKFPLLHSFLWRARKAVWRIQNARESRRPLVESGPILVDAIGAGRPLAAGKIGVCELRGLLHFLKRMNDESARERPAYPRYTADSLFLNAGVFPHRDDVFDRFGEIYLDAIKGMDVLVAWDLPQETMIFNKFAPKAALVPRVSLDSFFSDDPWTAALEGKRVLVVSPFTDTIRKQYARRTLLWRNQRILPEFTLLAVRAPLSAGLVAPTHPNWMAALDDMKARMDRLDFDVALVGAGAYSLPLVAYAKRRGKVGVHLGGTTQVLFGVYGGRWKDNKDFQDFINENWVRPSQSETPQSVTKIENGCYW